jgi:hypothetical protein
VKGNFLRFASVYGALCFSQEPEGGDGPLGAPAGEICYLDRTPNVAKGATNVLLRVLDRYAERPDPINFDGLRLDLELHAEPLERMRDLRERYPSRGEGGEGHVAGGPADRLEVDVNGSPG